MSKHNYSQYSNKKKTDNQPKQPKPNKADGPIESIDTKRPLDHEVKMEVELVKETVNTVLLPKIVEGVVVNCAKLNVRSEPSTNADVVCVLDVMSEIEIDTTKSNNDWFKVYTANGVEGYCMRKFVDARV